MYKGLIMLLAFLLFLSSLSVVYYRHQHRLEYIRLVQENAERDDLIIEWNTLMTAMATWSSQERIKLTAKNVLGMHTPYAAEIVSVQ